MNEEITELLAIIKGGKTEEQERGAEIYESLIEDPVSFFRTLYDFCLTTENSQLIDIALVFMEKIAREFNDSFTEEQKSEERQRIFPLIQKLGTNSYNAFSSFSMRVLAGSEKEWRELYTKANELEIKKRNKLISSMLNHVEESLLRQPITKDLSFAFLWASEIMETPGIECKIPLIKFLSVFISTYPTQIEYLEPYIPMILQIAHDSVNYDIQNYQQLWFHLNRLFAELPPDIEMYQKLVQIILANMSNEELPVSYKLPLVELIYTATGEVPLETALAAAECCNNFIKTYEGAVEVPPMSVHDFYCALYEKYNVTDVLGFMQEKVIENFSCEGENAILANIYLMKSMLIYCPSFFLMNWEMIDKLTDMIVENTTVSLLTFYCSLVLEMPKFFGVNPNSFKEFLPKIMQFLRFDDTDAVFEILSAILHVLSITKTRTPGITFPLMECAESIPSHHLGIFLTTVSASMSVEFLFSTAEIMKIVEFALPLLENEDPDILNGAIMICVEAMNLNDFIQKDLIDPVFTAIRVLIDSEDPGFFILGIERLSDMFEGFPEQATALAQEKIEVLQTSLTLDEEIQLPLKERALIAVAEIVAGSKISIVQEIAAIASEWITSESETKLCAAAGAFKILYKYSVPETAQGIFESIKHAALVNEDIDTVTYLLQIIADLIAQSTGEIVESAQAAGRELFTQYFTGQFNALYGVPPETTDINYEMLRAITRIVVESINGKNEEIPDILRFYEIIMERAVCPFEVYVQQTLLVWLKLIQADALEKEAIDHITEISFNAFTPKSHPIWYRDISKVVALLVKKKYIPRETILQRVGIIREWFEYCYERQGQMASFLYDLVAIIFFSFEYLDIKDEFLDLFRNSLEVLLPIPSIDTIPLPPTHIAVLSEVSEDEEFNAINAQVYCSFLSISRVMCKRLKIPEEAMDEMREKLKYFVSKSQAAAEKVQEYISESEGREEIFSFLYQ